MRGNVKLIYTSSSPYARKVRACIRYYEWHNIVEEMLHPFENEIEVRKLNPLGRFRSCKWTVSKLLTPKQSSHI